MSSILSQTTRCPALIAAFALAAVAGGCASGGPLSTGSITEPAALTNTSVDPACTALASQIDTLRKEGAVGRLEKAADGKTSTVTVQRASISKQAQLNKANADFIAKCGPNLPKTTVASVATPAAAVPTAAAAAATTAPAKAVAAAKSGVTSAANAGATITPQAAAAAAKAAVPAQ
jgi:hypothetical protein